MSYLVSNDYTILNITDEILNGTVVSGSIADTQTEDSSSAVFAANSTEFSLVFHAPVLPFNKFYLTCKYETGSPLTLSFKDSNDNVATYTNTIIATVGWQIIEVDFSSFGWTISGTDLITTYSGFAGNNITINYTSFYTLKAATIGNGTSGTDGSSGSSGVNGTSGSSGINGTDGSSGSSGINGTDGSSGVDGTSGSSGSSGVDGTSGSSGVDGSGTSGSSGVDGTSGSSGSSGVDGTSGSSGVDGSGTSGTSGSSGVDGTGFTTISTPVNNNILISTGAANAAKVISTGLTYDGRYLYNKKDANNYIQLDNATNTIKAKSTTATGIITPAVISVVTTLTGDTYTYIRVADTNNNIFIQSNIFDADGPTGAPVQHADPCIVTTNANDGTYNTIMGFQSKNWTDGHTTFFTPIEAKTGITLTGNLTITGGTITVNGVEYTSGTSGSSGVDGSGTSGSSGVDGTGGSMEVFYAHSGATSNFDIYPYIHLFTGATYAGGDPRTPGDWQTVGCGFYLKTAANTFGTANRQLHFGNNFYVNRAIGNISVSLATGGENTQATGFASAVIGGAELQANATQSVCIGGDTNTVNDGYSIAVGGRNNTISTQNSLVTGLQNTVAGISQTMVGQFGVSTGTTNAADLTSPKFIVGTGSDAGNRFNSLEVSHDFTTINNVIAITDIVTGTKYGLIMSGGTLTTYTL